LLFFGLYAKITTLKQRVDFYSLSFFATQLSFYGVIVWRFLCCTAALCCRWRSAVYYGFQ